MFEVGRDYRITTIVSNEGEWVHQESTYTVEEAEGALIKISSPYNRGPIILNTASQHFVKAELLEPDSSRFKPISADGWPVK